MKKYIIMIIDLHQTCIVNCEVWATNSPQEGEREMKLEQNVVEKIGREEKGMEKKGIVMKKLRGAENN